MKDKSFSIKDRLKSFTYAFKGIYSLFKKEHNSRIHLSAACLVIILGFYLGLSNTEWLVITLTIAFVLVAELFNTAIERLSDVVEPDWNKKIGEVKDYASGAVLISSIAAIVVGLIIFFPKLYRLIIEYLE